MKNKLNIDFWYGDTLQDVKSIDCFFSDVDCIYRGNMYNADRKIIGDYSCSDSVTIEEVFNVRFS